MQNCKFYNTHTGDGETFTTVLVEVGAILVLVVTVLVEVEAVTGLVLEVVAKV
jgi:hypothetical protein